MDVLLLSWIQLNVKMNAKLKGQWKMLASLEEEVIDLQRRYLKGDADGKVLPLQRANIFVLDCAEVDVLSFSFSRETLKRIIEKLEMRKKRLKR